MFFVKLISNKDRQPHISDISRTISDILLLHSGPILKFYLVIPRPLPLHLHTDFWIKNISNNGVKELMIFNATLIPYKMPSYLFSCSELTYLSLTNCILNPPLGFGGFRNLDSVELVDVMITAEMSLGTQLDEVILERCTGIEHLGCLFKNNNNLSVLIITDSGDIDWQLFECTKKMQLLSLSLKGVANSRKKVINLDKLVCNMPKIQNLLLDGLFFEFLEPGDDILQRWPITTMENLNFLYFNCVGFYDLVHIQYILSLIRSSPNLQFLMIEQGPNVKTRDGVEVVVANRNLMVPSIKQYLQLGHFNDMLLDELETVDIRCIVGSRAELQFIKFLLVSSPSLGWLTLTYNTTIDDPKEKLRISRKIKWFPRASPAAQIIWNN